ncbi:Sec-independent protein translocase protein TatB [uncultured Rhodospira sp.]|uniref:Sec-independent protein translocase protein TatB n=1 Tax=uncultured Rhodospira sp. TaxID=1936189 RepID=UPI0026334B0B|nr:Sec-independent protein translocase protein TatB [uncultured Rhodospira sp.]
MFDFGWTELAVIGVVALLIIGPKDLPKVLRTMGQWSRRLRSLAREFQGHVDDVIREAELEDVRDGVNKVRRTNVGQSLNKLVDPDGRVARELDDVERSARARPGKTPRLEKDGDTSPRSETPQAAPVNTSKKTPKSTTDED